MVPGLGPWYWPYLFYQITDVLLDSQFRVFPAGVVECSVLLFVFSAPRKFLLEVRKWWTVSYRRSLRNLLAPFCMPHTYCSIPFYQLVSRFFTPAIKMQLPVNRKKQANKEQEQTYQEVLLSHPVLVFQYESHWKDFCKHPECTRKHIFSCFSRPTFWGRLIICLRFSAARNTATRQCALNTPPFAR